MRLLKNHVYKWRGVLLLSCYTYFDPLKKVSPWTTFLIRRKVRRYSCPCTSHKRV